MDGHIASSCIEFFICLPYEGVVSVEGVLYRAPSSFLLCYWCVHLGCILEGKKLRHMVY